MKKRIPWQELCKFLAGAFFVSAGILYYFFIYRISIPFFGTGFMETPGISGVRAIVHTILFFICFYFGFMRKGESPSKG
jgi:hypothetical protein